VTRIVQTHAAMVNQQNWTDGTMTEQTKVPYLLLVYLIHQLSKPSCCQLIKIKQNKTKLS
jgi:hypothetical protein